MIYITLVVYCMETIHTYHQIFYYQLMHKKTVFKGVLKFYITITIAPARFGVITIIRERTMVAC